MEYRSATQGRHPDSLVNRQASRKTEHNSKKHFCDTESLSVASAPARFFDYNRQNVTLPKRAESFPAETLLNANKDDDVFYDSFEYLDDSDDSDDEVFIRPQNNRIRHGAYGDHNSSLSNGFI